MPPRAPAPRLTHFLCIPLLTPTSTPQLSASIAAFRTDCSAQPPPPYAYPQTTPNPSNGPPIHPSAIRPLGTLHLTLGVMSLPTPARITAALSLLTSLDLENLSSEDLEWELRGLKSMHDPRRTSVLYTSPVAAGGHVQRFGEGLRRAFVAAGLVVEDRRPLLLHATLVNTVYVPGVRGGRGDGFQSSAGGGGMARGGGGRGRRRARLVFDAREVLRRYEDTVWGRGRVEKVAICRMGAQRNGEGKEVYVVEGEVDVP